MFKLLFIGGLLYLLYRITFKPAAIPPSRNAGNIKEKMPPKGAKEDYIDYEEVD